eukprot:223576-Prymnesium_polylepis.2
MHDQFQFPTDNAAALREQPKGKRCFHPPSRSPLTREAERASQLLRGSLWLPEVGLEERDVRGLERSTPSCRPLRWPVLCVGTPPTPPTDRSAAERVDRARRYFYGKSTGYFLLYTVLEVKRTADSPQS